MRLDPDYRLRAFLDDVGRVKFRDGEPATKHQHIAIEWEGGVLWLDMSEQDDHYCIDIRQYRGSEQVPIGLFSILAGRRVHFDDSEVPRDERLAAHGWPATRMPILLTDKDSVAGEGEARS